MRWAHSEYMFKGAFLGLLVFVALQSPSWEALSRVGLWTLGGLAVGLVVGLADQVRRRQRLAGGPATVLLFLLMEYQLLIYSGLLIGLFAGAIAERNPERPQELLTYCVAGGAILGFAAGEMRAVRDTYYRLLLTAVVCAAGFGAVYFWLKDQPFFEQIDRSTLGLQIIAGLPFFYLLTFSGRAEESEVEIAMICAALGAGIWLMRFPENMPAAGFLVPVALYFVYATWVLPGLRVFKHVIQGYNYANAGRTRAALLAFRRALELDPKSELAREGLWWLHSQLQLARLEHDQETMSLLDFRMCLERVRTLLSAGDVPTDAQRGESERLLALVEKYRPEWKAETLYFRTLLDAHERRTDEAAEKLRAVLDPTAWGDEDKSRDRILLDAWRLALEWHPGLRERVGLDELSKPLRRMEAIGMIERRRAKAKVPDDSLDELRRGLYADLTEREYTEAVGDGVPLEFDHELIEQSGRALIDDPANWRRGVEYLNMVGHGVPSRGPGVYRTLARAAERAGDMNLVAIALQKAVQAGLKAGVEQLLEDQKQDFYAAVKRLADDAAGRGDTEQAIAHYTLYAQSQNDPKDTHRTLAGLCEKKGDVIAALKHTETALVYDAKDPDLLERKDRYYYSVEPDVLKRKGKEVSLFFDTDYCKRKAKGVLDAKNADAESLEWAGHLAKLAEVMEPKSNAVRTLVARCLLRRGERDEALSILEDVREEKPGSGDDEEAWYWTCQQLGRMYLDELSRPDLAIGALEDFKQWHKSGADTIYRLGQAYEATGDRARAMQCYEQVTAYERHPLVYEARSALSRLKSQA